MNKEALLKEKKQLEESRDQAVAQINQITGAIAMVDKLVADITTEESKDSESVDETPELAKAA